MLHVVDSLAGALYVLPDVPESRFIRFPEGKWHWHVRVTADCILANLREGLAALQPPELPPLRPWHLPQWMYDPQQNLIYYSDIEGEMEEILPSMSALLGMSDPREIEQMCWEQSPAVLAHEVFHFWRHAAGRLTNDYWYEEWAANALASAYIKQFHSELATTTLKLSERIFANHMGPMSETAKRLMERKYSADDKPKADIGYEVNVQEVAVIQAEMVRQLHANNSLSLEALARKLVGPQ